MKLLLDTHALIWALTAPERLPQSLLEIVDKANTNVFASAASAWEIAIKVALGRLRFPIERLPAALVDAAFKELRVNIAHGLEMSRLPLIHRDPFDRLLVAQARCEGLTLVTRDPTVRRYAIKTLWD